MSDTVDPLGGSYYAESLKEFKKDRDNSHIEKALEEIKRCVGKDENLVPPAFEAVKAYTTVGEISFFRNGPSLLMTGI